MILRVANRSGFSLSAIFVDTNEFPEIGNDDDSNTDTNNLLRRELYLTGGKPKQGRCFFSAS
jgi:hypothetical protein